MKIGFVFDDTLDKEDGIQQYMLSLQRWLTKHGHEVHFLVGETKRIDIPNVHSLSKNIKVNFNGNQLSIPLYGNRKRIAAVLQNEQFDVLHVSLPYHPYMAGWVMKMAPPSTASIGTFHILPYSKIADIAGRFQALLSRSSQKRLQAAVSVSPGAQAFAKNVYKLSTTVVPNAFDYQRFASAQPLAKYNDDTTTILFLGRLVERKGCALLLEAIKRLQSNGKEYSPYRVVICGAGPLDAKLRSFVAQNDLGKIVSFEGRVSEADKPGYYAAADISVFPSTSGESFGIVLVEAMANGRTAVVGADNPGYSSVLGDRPDAMFKANDVNAIVTKLDDLLSDQSKTAAIAEWAAQNVKQYDVEVVGAQIVKIYKSVATNSSIGS